MISLKDLAIDAAIEASKSILAIYEKPFDVIVKSDLSPLTQADLESDKIIRSILIKSQIPIISEEVEVSDSDVKRFWCVDPLDGTKEFVNKSGEFAINIALIEDGIPVFGLICAPILHCMWYSSENEVIKLDYLNQTKEIYRADNSPKSEWKLLSGTLSNEGQEAYNSFLKSLPESKKVVDKHVGSSIKFALMSEAKADVYLRFGRTYIWDTAAGHALLRCIGGDILDMQNKKSLTYSAKKLANPHFIAFTQSGKLFF